jgi:glycerol-3-phosphate responsive antiterminator
MNKVDLTKVIPGVVAEVVNEVSEKQIILQIRKTSTA